METMEKTPEGMTREAIERGSTGNEVASELEKRAREAERAERDIRDLQAESAAAIEEAVDDPDVIEGDNIEYLRERGHDTETAEVVGGVQTPEEAVEVSKTLEATAADIRSSVGSVQNADLDDGVAGQAFQGQGGSSQIDIGTAVKGGETGGESLVDKAKLDDIKKHEKRHEIQTNKRNAESVKIDDNTEITWTEVSEYDAMNQQSSIAFVSDEYKKMYAKVAGLGLKGEVTKVVTKTGDLEGLGRNIRKKKGVREQYQTAA